MRLLSAVNGKTFTTSTNAPARSILSRLAVVPETGNARCVASRRLLAMVCGSYGCLRTLNGTNLSSRLQSTYHNRSNDFGLRKKSLDARRVRISDAKSPCGSIRVNGTPCLRRSSAQEARNELLPDP